MMAASVSEISRLQQVRALLEQIKSPATAVRIARSAIQLITEEEADRLLPARFAEEAKRGAAKLIYKVETTGLGENVAEYRPGGNAKPFRCPRNLYETMAAIFSESSSELTILELVAEIEKRMGRMPGDHQYRPAIRLWMHVQPPLLERNRSRYRPRDKATFLASSARLWKRLRVF